MESISASPPPGVADGELVFLQAFAEVLRPPPKLSVSQWADAHRFLSAKASSEYGKWRTARAPFLREIMDCFSSSSSIEEVVLMKGSQVGGTEALLNVAGYVIDHAPGPIQFVWPTSAAGKRNSKQRLTPLIEESPALRARVKESRSRDSGNTTMMKEFAGGVLLVAGANSATELKSSPVKVSLQDEVDEYPADVDGQGDPIALADARVSNFTGKKKGRVSTPTVEGFSRIGKLYKASDQRHFYVPCPSCSHEQVLVWDQFRWELVRILEYTCTVCGMVSDGKAAVGQAEHECPECHERRPVTDQVITERQTADLARVWYECVQCQVEIGEQHKTAMLAAGRWIAHNPGPNRAAGFHLPAFYAPIGWKSWREIVLQWLASEGQPEQRKVWINTVAGEAYEDRGIQPDWTALKVRAEAADYRLGDPVPIGGLMLSAMVDVQADRLECKVKAWGRGTQSWLVGYERIHGDPEQNSVWAALDEYLQRKFDHASGVQLRIAATFIDSGYLTNTVYEFCRTRAERHILPSKGVGMQGKPALMKPSKQDVDFRGKVVKEGVTLWPLGVHTLKSQVYGRLRIEWKDQAQPAPDHYMHLPAGLPDEYFEQLTAEKLITVYSRGHPRQEFHLPKNKRNEALDLEAGCLAAALYAGLGRVNWDKLERVLGITHIKAGDLFNAPPATDSPPAPAPVETTPPADPSRGRRVRSRGNH